MQPSNTAAAASITPALTVQIQDQFGNLTSSTASVTVAIGTNAGGGTLSGTTTKAAVAGVATFSGLSINKSGTGYTLSATSTSLTGATSNTFDITAGAASKLAFGTQPSNTTAGQPITPAVTVRVLDASDNLVTTSSAAITMAIGTNPGGGALIGTTSVAAVNGVATFSDLSINKSGVGYTLSATSSPLTGATSTAFNITGGTATKLAFIQQPTNAVAGAGITPAITVQVQDNGGNLVTTSSASITLAISANPGSGTLSGTTTVSAVNGVATFSGLSINKTGTGYTLAVSSAGLTGTTSSTFNVTPGAATQLAFGVQPSNAQSGASISPAVTVQLLDANGNLVTTSSASVTVAIANNPAAGTLGGTKTVNAASGVATFTTLSIDKVGTGYTLAATSASLASATSSAFNIAPGAAAKLVFAAQPSNASAGQAIAPAVTVQVLDANNNLVTSSNAAIGIAIANNPGGGTLSGTTSIAAVNGMATFSDLSINKVGSGYTLSATSAPLTGATSIGFNITAGAAAKLAFGQQPTSSAAGAAITPAVTVQVQDSGGNLVTTSTALVSIAIGANPAGGTLGGTATVNASGGVATFGNLSIDRSGTGYTLAASSSGLAGVTSNAFNIAAGALDHFAFAAIGSQTAGIAFNITIVAQDAGNNTVADYDGNGNKVVLESTGVLVGTPVTTPAFTNGVLATSVTITNTGNFTISAMGNGNRGGAGTSNLFTVVAGAVASITISPTSSAIAAGGSQPYTVTAFDAFANSIGTVAASLTIAPDGVCASGSCSATLPGAHTVTATYSGHTAMASLQVNAGALDHIRISPASATITAGGSQAYTATGFDSFSNSLGDVTAATTFSIAPDGSCTGASCTATVAGTHTVTGNDGGKMATASLQVNAGTLDHISISPASASITAGGSQAYTAQGFDQSGNSLGDVTAATTFSIAPDGSCTAATCTASVAGAHTVTGSDAGKTATASLNVDAGTLDHLVLSPSDATIAAGDSQSYTASAVDAFDNSLGDVTAATTFTISPDGSCTGATCTASVSDAHTVTGTDGGRSGIATLTVTPGTLTNFLVEATGGGAIQPQTAGTPFDIRITARDQYNNTVDSFAGTVQITSNGTLTGSPVASGSFVNGVLASQSVTITSAQTGTTISATGGGGNGTSNGFAVNPAGVNNFLIEAAGGGNIAAQTAGAPFDIWITARDQFNNTVVDFAGALTLSTNAGVITPAIATFTGAESGILAVTGVEVTQAGQNKHITASFGADTGTSNDFTVNAGGVGNFLIEQAGGGDIGPQTAHAPFDIWITARDDFNNTVTDFTGTVTLSTDAGTIAPTTVDFVAADDGIHTASVTVTEGGTNKHISATFNADTGMSNPFTVNKASATLTLDAATLNQTFDGTPRIVTATTVPPGLTVTITYNGSATAPTNAGSYAVIASLSAPDYAAPDASGTLQIAQAGSTVTLSCPASVMYTGAAQTPCTASVTGAGLSQSVMVSYTNNINAGTASASATFAGDANHGGSSNSTTFAINQVGSTTTLSCPASVIYSGAAQTPCTASATGAGLSQSVMVSYTNNVNAGTASASATFAGDANHTGSSDAATFTIQQASTTTSVTSSLDPATADDNVSFTAHVTAGASGSVQFVVDGVNYGAPVALSGGTATIAFTNKTTGTYAVSADYSGDANFTGSSGSLAGGQVVTAGAPAQLAFDTQPTDTAAGQAITPAVSVRILDAVGNQTASTASVTVATGDPDAFTAASTTAVAALAGVATFADLHINTAGTYKIGAASPGLATATSTAFTVTPGTAVTFAFTVPASIGAGQSFDVTLTAKDMFNNTATGYGGVVHFTSSDPQASLPADTQFAAGDNGVHSFSLATVLRTSGNQTLTATDTASASISGTSPSILVNPGNATVLVVSAPAAIETAGTPFSVTVQAQDAYGNTASGYVGPIHFTSTDPSADLPADYTFVPGTDQGAHTFDVTLHKAGQWTVTATDVPGGFSGVSGSITVQAGAAAKLAFRTQPASTVVGVAIADFVVEVQDADGNLVSGSTATIGIALGNNPNAAMLSGTTSVQAVDGAATFSGLTLDKAASGDTLVTTSAPLASATSDAFDVGKGTATLSLSNLNQTYDGSPKSVTVSTTPAGLSGVMVTYNGSATPPMNAGNYAVVAKLDNADYAAPDASGTLQIAPASSTVSLSCPASVMYTGAAQTPCTAGVTGAGGLSQSVMVSYTNNVNAGTASASATFAGDANHTGSSDAKTFSIAPATSTTTVSCPASVTYTGVAQTPCTASVTGAGGLSLAPAPTYAGNINAGLASASYSYGGDANHTGSSASANFAIAKAVLTAKADNQSRVYGDPNPPLTASYSGFVNGQTLATSGVIGTPALTTTATQASAVGTYPITIAQGTLTASNYEFMFVNGSLTVYLGGIVGLNSVTTSGSASADSFDSSAGSYANSKSSLARILSNGTISLTGTKVYGNVLSATKNVMVGTGSVVTGNVTAGTTISNSGTIGGMVTANSPSSAIVAPAVAPCSLINASAALSGNYTYDATKGNLTVSGGKTATIANGNYCFNTLTLSGGSTLTVNGPVKIGTIGAFNASGGSLVNTTLLPSNLQIAVSYSGNNGVTLSGGSSAYLTVYAPGTDVTLSGSSPLYGALVGKTLTLSGSSAVHFDVSVPALGP